MGRELTMGGYVEADGTPIVVYGYRINGEFVFDPRSSVDGRNTADPLLTYGVTSEELVALDIANLVLNGAISRVGDIDPTRLADIKGPYSEFYVAQTGGRCTALRLDRPDGSYLMLTGPNEAHEPEATDPTIDCGFYQSEWDYEGTIVNLPVREVKAWIASQLAGPLLSADEKDQAQFESIVETIKWRVPEATTPEKLLEHRELLDAEDIRFLERVLKKNIESDSDPDFCH